MAKDNKKTSKIKEVINSEFWQSKRGKAIFKLMLWGLFFVAIFIYIGINNSFVNNNMNKQVEINFDDELKKLKDSNYTYNFKITKDNVITTYEGKVNNNIDEGFKSENDLIIKYLIEADKIYKVTTAEKTEIIDLYSEYNVNFLSLNKLIDYLVSLKSIKLEDNKYKYTIDQKVIILTVYEDKKIEVSINDSNIIYSLLFENIKENIEKK